MTESIRVSAVIPGSVERIYKAWLNSKEHSAFTGSKAVIASVVGGEFTAWDGYIQGNTLVLDPYSRIIQSWRTSEFPPGSPDSWLDIRFREVEGGTEITLVHTDIPEGQGQQYEQGWREFYFGPMKAYFESSSKLRE